MTPQQAGAATETTHTELEQGIWLCQQSANCLTLRVNKQRWEIPKTAQKKHDQANDDFAEILFSGGDSTEMQRFIGSLQRRR